jgi:hypothetical protein
VFDEATVRNITVTGVSTLGIASATTLYVSGVTTLGVATATNLTSQQLNVSGITTTNSLNIDTTQVISSARQLQNIASLDATTTATIEAAIANAPNTFTDITVTGVSTFVGLATFNNGLWVVSGVTTLGVATATNLTSQQLNVSGLSTFAGITTVTGATLFSRQLNVSGVSTLGTVQVSSGIVTATSGIVTYYGDGSNLTNILSGVGIGSLGTFIGIGATILNFIGTAVSTVTVSSGIATIKLDAGAGGGGSPGGTAGQVQYNNFGVFGGSSNFTFDGSNVNVTGVITATSFVGNGSGLTGAGSTVFIDTTTNQEFFPLFTSTTSGTITASGISTSKLTYNPSTGTVTAVDFNSTSDINLKENIHTVGNALEITEQLRGVSFDWKETGRSSYGVIAQELEAVLPELVKQGEVKSVNYNGIIGVLIEAIKELKKEIADLRLHVSETYTKKSEVETLKADMDKRFDRLEQMIGRLFDKLDSKVDK